MVEYLPSLVWLWPQTECDFDLKKRIIILHFLEVEFSLYLNPFSHEGSLTLLEPPTNMYNYFLGLVLPWLDRMPDL